MSTPAANLFKLFLGYALIRAAYVAGRVSVEMAVEKHPASALGVRRILMHCVASVVVVIVIAFVLGANYGLTIEEPGDALLGGVTYVNEGEVTEKQQWDHGVFVFWLLLIPVLWGIIEKFSQLRQNR